MRKRVLFLCSIIPFFVGFTVAFFYGKQGNKGTTTFSTNYLPQTDKILLSSKGDIYTLTAKGSNQITYNQQLIEPVFVGNTIAAITKKINYASLKLYNKSGKLIQTLFDGKSGNIDTMRWISDPAVSPDGKSIAYVSDKERGQTNVPDNTLFLVNLSDGKSTIIANPAPYSGGIAHPVFNPINGNIILYDYYQYDTQTLTPYSTIEEYNKETGITTTLTFEKRNAYQESFSPDGKQLLFLERNGDANTVTLYRADFTNDKLSNIHEIANGDFAYPVFSYAQNHIYYLEATGNSGYNLLTGTIQQDKLTHILPIATGSQLLGNSSYTVTKSVQ